jgi:hypothetical protein
VGMEWRATYVQDEKGILDKGHSSRLPQPSRCLANAPYSNDATAYDVGVLGQIYGVLPYEHRGRIPEARHDLGPQVRGPLCTRRRTAGRMIYWMKQGGGEVKVATRAVTPTDQIVG